MGKRNAALTLKQKFQLIKDFKNNNKLKKELAKEYQCDISTVNRIIRNESKIVEFSKTNQNNSRKRRIREGADKNVERALSKWFNQTRSQNGIISSTLLLNKAKEFAVKLGSDFEPTNDWLWRWQKRENISVKKIHGESGCADTSSANDYVQNILPLLLEKYEPQNVFNADESGLYFKALPNATLNRRGFQATSCKMQKERLTLLFICNSTGDYKEIITIGKRKNPRCFKNKTIPVKYFFNQNAWMTTELWNSILSKLDEEMIKENRKIILFADNAACHKLKINLKNIDLQFLPANTTSLIQPLDQGIIHCFKAYYRQIIVRKQILALESGKNLQQFVKSINILDALHYAKRAWWLVQKESIINSFKKAKFTSIISSTENGGEEVIETLLEDIIPTEQFKDYIQCDVNVECYGTLTEDEIVEEIINEEGNDSNGENEQREEQNIGEEDEVVDEEEEVDFKTVVKALTSLRKYSLQKNNIAMEDIENIEEQFYKKEIRRVQSKITDYFS